VNSGVRGASVVPSGQLFIFSRIFLCFKKIISNFGPKCCQKLKFVENH
jgi:hypothetical protein